MIGVVQKTALTVAATVAFLGSHIDLQDAVIIAGVAVYIFTVVKDYRPAKKLREELREVRAELAERDKQYADLERRYVELERKYEALEKGRDFSLAFEPLKKQLEESRAEQSAESKKTIDAMHELATTLGEGLQRVAENLEANTAAVSGTSPSS